MNRDVAQPPNPTNVHAGAGDEALKKKVGEEGARTIPGRPEHGGNCDIKNLSRGSKVYLPVHVPGAKFSVGDLHFSQGDGEISFCGAIEMAGVITIKFTVMKDGVKHLGMKSPIYIPGAVEPNFGPGRHIYFEGFSVDSDGKQHFLDTTVAYRQTTLRCIEYLRRYGYSDYQVYLLLSCAPVQGHIAGIVDVSLAFAYRLEAFELTMCCRFPMLARLWDFPLTSLTLTLDLRLQSTRSTWELVRLRPSNGIGTTPFGRNLEHYNWRHE